MKTKQESSTALLINCFPNKRILLCITLVLLLSLMGCGAVDSAASREGEVQQVTILAEASPFLEKCIAAFNGQNSNYEVVLLDWSEEPYLEDVQLRLQAQLAAGNGPDLIDSNLIRLYPFARNGYLEPVEEWLLRYENLLPQAVSSGQAGDHCYIIPYRIRVQSLVTTSEIADGRAAWTLEEMLDTANQRQTTTLYLGARSWDVLHCMLTYDEGNPTYVDWEQKLCHFDTEEFVALLEYTKQWGDTQSQLISDHMDREFADGHILTQRIYPSVGSSSLADYYRFLSELGEDCVYIGFPVENGNGTFVDGKGYVINSASKCKDGAKEFMDYLLTPEQQMAMWRELDSLPADLQVLELIMTEYASELYTKEETQYLFSKKYGTEEASRYLQILKNSKAQGKQYDDIVNIIYDETSGYYEGNRDPWEVARVLQNRIQLYLNEQK